MRAVNTHSGHRRRHRWSPRRRVTAAPACARTRLVFPFEESRLVLQQLLLRACFACIAEDANSAISVSLSLTDVDACGAADDAAPTTGSALRLRAGGRPAAPTPPPPAAAVAAARGRPRAGGDFNCTPASESSLSSDSEVAAAVSREGPDSVYPYSAMRDRTPISSSLCTHSTNSKSSQQNAYYSARQRRAPSPPAAPPAIACRASVAVSRNLASR